MKRPAFTLIELLVVTATVLVLVTLSAAAVSGARSSQRKSQTRVTISKINDILMSQWRTYPSQSVKTLSAWTRDQYKRCYRMTGDMPPNWEDVKVIYQNSSGEFTTRAQQTYRNFWYQKTVTQLPSDQYADGECLFLTVMYGGFAGCLDCAGLRAGKDFADTDSDGAQEFIDAWGNPLGFVLWPAGLVTPDGSAFFPLGDLASDKLTYELRPLIFSAGPNGQYGINIGGSRESDAVTTATFSNLSLLQNCGLPSANNSLGSALNSSSAADNITNFDAEFRR